MSVTDMTSLKKAFQPGDLGVATALLTRLPLPHNPSAKRAPSAAAWAYPLVGLIIAAITLAVGWVLQWLGTTVPITAAFVLLSMIMITGAMHEDGLADCADGFWGGWSVERRLEIMKDSTIGTYGVVALVMSLLLRWYLLIMMIDKGVLVPALLVAAVMSRAAMVWIMFRLGNARISGLSAQTGRPGGLTALGALVIGVAAAVLAPEVSWFWLLFFAALATFTAGLLARAKIGGQTGDVLGATQQMVEIAVLVAFDVMVTTWA